MNNLVYAGLKQAILLLDYKPGEVLSVKKLAEELGVSATPIREALVALEAEGLVHREPRSHVRVTEVSLQDVKDVFEVRLLLSEQIGAFAAQRVTPEELLSMEEVLDRMKSESDQRTLTQLDDEFHQLVHQATKNKALAKVAEMLRNQVVRLWFFIGDDSSYWPHVLDGREKLIDALRKRDVDSCKRILRSHVSLFLDQVTERISAKQV